MDPNTLKNLMVKKFSKNAKPKSPLHDMQTFAEHKHPDTSDLEWKSKDGRLTAIKDMDTRHVENTIRLIARGDHARVDTNHTLYKALQTELEWRQQIVEKGSSSILTGKERDIPDLSPGGVFFNSFEE